MHTIIASFEFDSARRSLERELADVDARQLLDMGLVRLPDGSLRSAEDPAQPLGGAVPRRPLRALLGGLAGLFRWLRSLPLKSPEWRPHFFLRE